MDSLETQIREVLIARRAEEIHQRSKDPGYQAAREKSKEQALGYVETVLGEAFAEGTALPESIQEVKGPIREEIRKSAISLVEAFFALSGSQEQNAYESAKAQYTTREEFEAKLEPLYADLSEEDEFSGVALAELKKAHEPLFAFVELQDRIVSGLVEIAESRSIDQALTREAEHEVTRRIFLTAEDYIAHWMNGLGAPENYFVDSILALSMHGGETAFMTGILFHVMKRTLELDSELTVPILTKEIHQKSQEIYGAPV
jgi:hypothetical protein